MNSIRQKLLSNELSLGSWLQINSPTVAGIMAAQNYDWLTIDAEHGAVDLNDISMMCDAIQARQTAALVRLPACDSIWVSRCLDAGADGLIIPMVHNAEIARKAVEYAKYPPLGKRGFGFAHTNQYGQNFDEYVQNANEHLTLVAQIEHIEAVKDIDNILAVEGIDAVIIGPYDLAGSMGLVGQPSHPDVLAACDKVLMACQARNSCAGIHVVSSSAENIQPFIDKGFRFVALGIDALFLRDTSTSVLQSCRPAKGDLSKDY